MRCASVSSGLSPRSASLWPTMRPRLVSNTSVAWQHGHVSSTSDLSLAITVFPERAGEPARLKVLLQLQRRAVGQLRDQAQIDDLLALETEPLAEAGDERVERHLKAAARRNRRRRHPIVGVQPDLDHGPILRRSIVDGQQ